jgi:hypothetical protein
MTNWWTELQKEMQPISKTLRTAVYGSGGAPFHHAGLMALWGSDVQALSGDDIRSGKLSDIDVIVFPGGGMRAMEGMLEPLGVEGAKAVREWVAEGGMYIGSCAGSFLPACIGQGYWNAHAESKELYMVPACLANGGDSEWEGLTSPGVGVIEVAVANPKHWLAEGLPEHFKLVHYNGPMFMLEANQPAFDKGVQHTKPEGVVRFVKATKGFTPSEGFMASALPSPTLFERCIQQGAYSAITTSYGKGTVVLFGSHPEFGFDVMQLGWGQGTRLFANALKYQAKGRGNRSKNKTDASIPVNADSLRVSLSQIAARLTTIAARFEALAKTTPKAWLESGQTPSFMGLSSQRIWQEGLMQAAKVSKDTSSYLRKLVKSNESDKLPKASKWIDSEAKPGQDFGFVGLRQLVRMIETFIDDGEQKLAGEPFALKHPYDGFLTHPFHLLVGSYLSAIGLTSGVALSSAVIGSTIGYLEGVPVGPLREEAWVG